MYKACIFDLDGTLTDTLDSLTYSVNETLREMGIREITRDECRIFVGNGSRVLLEKALRAGNEADLNRIDEAMDRYGRIFHDNCTYHVIPYDGIPELLGVMKDQGICLGVLSNKPDRQAVHVVEEIFGKDVFQCVRGQKEGIPRKPDPAGALLMAQTLGADPEETLYIGDSEVDIETGHAANMRTIGVSWGFRGRAGLEAAGAETIVDSPEEIVKMIRNTWEVERHE